MVERVEEILETGRGGEEQRRRQGDTETRGQGEVRVMGRRAVFAG
jgi:hypothetical protein